MRDALPEAPRRARVGQTLVAALGNAACGDDGAGPLALALLRCLGVPAGVRLERVGDPLLLIELWREEDHVILLDAARGDVPVGECVSVDALAEELPAGLHPLSSHGMGLVEALGLAREVGRLPASLLVHAVVGTAFGEGDPLSEPVRRGAEALARRLHEEFTRVPRTSLQSA